MNIPKPGTKEYYIDALELITVIALGYDGYNPSSAPQMRKLVNDLVEVAEKALKKETIWVEVGKETKKYENT